MNETSVSPERRQRIAVVAVHGVGDQQPLESARAIGDLLQNIDVGGPLGGYTGPPCGEPPGTARPRYDPFSERALRINVRPVVVSSHEDAYEQNVRGPFHAWADGERERRAAAPAPREARSTAEEASETSTYDDWVSYRFMRGQLQCYHGEGPENTYETIRLEGKRTAYGDPGERTVHVYELYWADLSTLKASIFTIFTELYQVLFHLSSLGTHVVDAEALHHRHVSWTWLRRLQSWAAVCLTVPIPIINLFMLGVAVVLAGLLAFERLSLEIQTELAIAVAALAVVVWSGLRLWRSRNTSVVKWVLPLIVWLALAFATWSVTLGCVEKGWYTGGGVCGPLARTGLVLATLSLTAVAAALVAFAVVAYNRRRPGTKAWAMWLASILFPAAGATFLWTGFSGGAQLQWFRLLEFLYSVVMVAWGVYALLAIGAWAAGVWALKHVSSRVHADRAARGRWTARLTLSLPAFSFIVVTLVAWGLVWTAFERMVPADAPYESVWFDAITVHDLLDNLWSYGGGPALPVLLAVGLLAALPAIWGLAPVVWTEVRPPDFQRSRRRDYPERLGDWLTVTFKGLRLSGQLLYVTMTFVVPLVVAVIVVAWLQPELSSRLGASGRWLAEHLDIEVLGSISAALIAWLFAMRGQLKKAALGFRTVLDVMLDVDNWLREHPLDGNPTARICGRFVSLLRHICNWRDPFAPESGYDAIVFVAHSQGTVVTADLLRFLKREAGGSLSTYDPELAPLEKMHVSLFTMGCPLRDLYGLRFPRLYGWARHEDEAAMPAWGTNDLVSGPRPAAGPTPGDLLAIDLWVNAYRSGDYIGRFLWRTGKCRYLWTSDSGGAALDALTPSMSSDGVSRLEFCIGAGAHTHYWDRTAPIIGMELDRLIALRTTAPP